MSSEQQHTLGPCRPMGELSDALRDVDMRHHRILVASAQDIHDAMLERDDQGVYAVRDPYITQFGAPVLISNRVPLGHFRIESRS